MSEITSKGQRWEWLHSLWLLWVFALGFFGWVAFMYVGSRVKQPKWIVWGLVYALPLVSLGVLSGTPAWDAWADNVVMIGWLVLGVSCAIHAFRIRPEYLLRLEAQQQRYPADLAEMRRRIHREQSAAGAEAEQALPVQSRSGPSAKREKTTSPRRTEADVQMGAPQLGDAEHPAQGSEYADPARTVRKLLNINEASEEELAALPGVGSVLAKRAVAERARFGSFTSLEAFGEVLDLKPHQIVNLRSYASAGPIAPQSGNTTPGRIVDY